jgi:hypothetical protein
MGLAFLAFFAWFGWKLYSQPHTGADFIAYYTAARIVDTGRAAHLYDLALQDQVQAQVLGIPLSHLAHPLNFINPPSVALLLAPFGQLSLNAAYTTWILAMLLLLLAACLLLPRLCGLHARTALLASLLCVAFYPSFITVIRGQIDSLALLAVALSFAAWRSQRPALAGLALGLALVKPQLLLALLLYLALSRSWRALGAFAGFGLAWAALTAMAFGPQVWWQFITFNLPGGTFSQVPYAGSAALIYSVYGLAAALALPAFAGWAMAAGCVTAFVWAVWRWRPSPAVGFAAALALSIPISPHRGAQDLVLVLLPLLVLAQRAPAQPHPWQSWTLLALAGLALQLCLLADWPATLAMLALAAFLLFSSRPAPAPATTAPTTLATSIA